MNGKNVGRAKYLSKRPLGVTVIVIFNILGWITTEGMWLYLHATRQIPEIASMNSFWEKSYIGLVNGFTVADAIWSNLTLLLAIFGLWKMKPWGWTAAMMANAIWVYTMTCTMVRDLSVKITFGLIFFSIFALGALASTAYLWHKRSRFWKTGL
ncbi:MAG: hypothetical protein QHH06_12170 [Clostridiales bacterium]|nr:hypothetical protein [Eubacteriales bacterium]MDH7567208.1 hypothetical protein [Clostridiales bacterium]